METQSMGKRIMSLRKEKGLTQEQLAEMLNISAQAISKWENDVSCPDISVLPKLSEVLGTTTDELLGVKPVEPRVIVVDTPNSREQAAGSGGFKVTYEGNKRSGIGFGIMVILLGLAFLLTRTNILPHGAADSIWQIVWPAVLLGLGVSWLINDRSLVALGIAVLGLHYLLYKMGAVSYEPSWSIIWPTFIVLFGVNIVIDKLWPKKRDYRRYYGDGEHKTVSEYNESSGFVRLECAFAEDRRKVTADVLCGGDVDTSFGKAVLDLTGVKRVSAGAKLEADVSFGTFELVLPKHIRIQLESDKAFGAINVHGEAAADAVETLRVDGDVSFGSMEIRYC